MRPASFLIPAAALTGIIAWAEVVHWRSSRRGLGGGRRAGGAEAVIVLGFRNRSVKANYLNRYRVRAGLRSQDPHAKRSVLVLCGGTVAGDVSEAEVMARYARYQLGYTGPIRLDRKSTSTWENIQNVIPLVEDMDTLKIVSNSLHAEKGRAYLWRQRPDIAERLVRAEEHRFGELALLKPVLAVIGLNRLGRLRRG